MKKFYFQGPHFTPFIAGSGPPCIFFGVFPGGSDSSVEFSRRRVNVAAVTAGRFSSPCASECHMSACEVWVAKGGGCFTQTTTTTTTTRTTYPNINHIYLCFIYEYTTCVFAGFLIFLGLACFGQHLSLPLGQKLTATRRSERNDLRLWAAWPQILIEMTNVKKTIHTEAWSLEVKDGVGS